MMYRVLESAEKVRKIAHFVSKRVNEYMQFLYMTDSLPFRSTETVRESSMRVNYSLVQEIF